VLRRTSALALLLLALPAFLAGSAPSPTAAQAAQAAPDIARRECERLNDSGSYADALPHCREAAARLRGAGAQDDAQDGGDVGRALNSLGLALEMTGDRSAAEASYREALGLHRGLGQPAQEALVLSNLAALAIAGGDYGAALAWLAEEEAVTRRALAAGDSAWAPAELDYVRMNRSVALEQLGAYAEALAQIGPLASRVLAQGAPETATSESAALAVNLAVLYRNLGDPRRALALLDQARVVYEGQGDRSALANVHLNRGLVFQLNLRAPAAAETALTRALELSRESGDRSEETRTLCALGDLRLSGGHLVEARSAFALALASATASDATAGRWAALAGLGRVARAAGDPGAALVHLRGAIAEIEKTGEGVGDSALRGGLLADQRAVYATAVDLLAERARMLEGPEGERAALEALALAEQVRARELLDALAGGGSGSPLQATQIAALSARLGTTIVYFFGERSLWRWVHEGGRWQIAAAGGPMEIRALVAGVHRSLARAEPPPPEALARLSRLLLPQRIARAKELRIVPDGRLFYLPFELLADPERSGEALIERFPVSYLPSLSMLTHLRGPAATARWRVVALADPELPLRFAPGDTSSLASLLARRFGLPPLPGAAREARDAAARLGEPNTVELGSRATEAKLRLRAGEGIRVLHIAAHTVVDESLAGGVALFLAAGTAASEEAGAPGAPGDRPPGGEDDGLVTAAELASLRLEVELAVLSGCRTALAEPELTGSDGAGGGRALASLSGALLGAGVRGVVASLWEVGDGATAALMEQFYFELARGSRPASALRRAKLRLAHDPRWNGAPGWAGFVLLGDPGPVARPYAAWSGLAAAIAAIAAIALGLPALLRALRPAQRPQAADAD
jgi:CHAT domain-containing protein/tetratricopeptide (TPR) repeat protein